MIISPVALSGSPRTARVYVCLLCVLGGKKAQSDSEKGRAGLNAVRNRLPVRLSSTHGPRINRRTEWGACHVLKTLYGVIALSSFFGFITSGLYSGLSRGCDIGLSTAFTVEAG